MPSVSKAQHNKMAMDCKNPSTDKGKKVPRKVACEFMKADKRKK